VQGVLGLIKRWGQVGPYLFQDPQELEQMVTEPRYNLAKTLRLMLRKKPAMRLAAVLRGCDVRALRTLEQQGEISTRNLICIGIVCSQEQAEECNCPKPVYNTFSCVGCWKCLEACPVQAIERVNVCPILVPSEWNQELCYRKAAYIPFAQAVPMKATRDSQHCLQIKGEQDCKGCEKVCGPQAIDNSAQPEDIQVDVGSIILATGFDLMDPSSIQQFGYGHFPNVLTSLEFERLNNATGPTAGEIRLRSFQGDFQDKPQSVGIIHCVGSRDSNHHEYCSRVCCMYALKYAHLIKDKLGHEVPVYNFYIDLRCFGKGYEEFYRRVQEEGVILVRGRPAEITDHAQSPAEEGKLTVVCEDTLLGRNMRIPVDMVILCPAMEASQDTAKMARMVGLNQGRDGFLLEEHPKLGPNTTATDGIFLAGCCQGPRDIPDSVSHASGAASQALSLATRGQVSISPSVSWIDPDICIGCQICIGLCAYGAITFDARRGVSVVNEAVCKGCGSCSGYCPSGAAQVRHFGQKQVFAELEGLLEPVYETNQSSQDYAREEPAEAG
jgi:heterodisulfide reductase subunit A